MSDDKGGHCIVTACCCGYEAIDCNNIDYGCRGQRDCLCIRESWCLSCNAASKGFLLTTDKSEDSVECCKLGLFCCDCGLIKPQTLCAGSCSFLCCYEVFSCPCDEEYVPKCVCAYLFLQCAPECGCCTPPPPCPALDKLRANEVEALTMDRGDEPVKAEVVEEKPKE